MIRSERLSLCLVALALLVPAAQLPAATCSIPASYDTIQAAVDDPTCDLLTVAWGIYDESVVISRSLSLIGPSSDPPVLRGLLKAEGAGTVVSVTSLRIENGCESEGMVGTQGAIVEGQDVKVIHEAGLSCPATPGRTTAIFTDDFETGDMSQWSALTQ